MADFVISYDTIMELLRNEKDRSDLQKLDEVFYEALYDYLSAKLNNLNNASGTDSYQKLMLEFNNLKRMINDLYDRRERKIVTLALLKARTPSAITDFSAMHPLEKSFFNALVELFESYRNTIIGSLFEGKYPGLSNEALNNASSDSTRPKPIEKPHTQPLNKPQDLDNSTTTPHAQELTTPKLKAEPAKDNQKESFEMVRSANPQQSSVTTTAMMSGTKKLVRFIHGVPRFVGRELEVYGPFAKGDVAELPAEIADLLIKKKRAEELNKS